MKRFKSPRQDTAVCHHPLSSRQYLRPHLNQPCVGISEDPVDRLQGYENRGTDMHPADGGLFEF
jgi:hypothetical protein